MQFATYLRGLPFALLTVTGCNCGDTLSSVPGDIKGRVCDPETGAGIGGAALALDGSARTTLTDADGRYTFSRVSSGAYTVIATAAELAAPRTFELRVSSGATAIVEDTACRAAPGVPGTGNLDGQICNRHTGERVTDGDVIMSLSNGELMVTATDENGAFAIDRVPVGEHIVTISGVGYQRAFLVEINEGATTTLDLADDCEPVELGEGGVVGAFCDPQTGGNLINANVTVSSESGEGGTDITDIDGQFEVNGLPPGTYAVLVDHPNSVVAAEVDVVAGEIAVVLDLASCPDRPQVGRVEGQICDINAGGVFVGNADLMLDTQVVATAATDASGNFVFTDVAAGTYTVRLYRDGYERVFAGIVVEAFRTALVQERDCPEEGQVCGETINNPQETADGRILLVVDKSGSMGEDFSGDPGIEKWEATRDALINVTATLTTTVEFGLVLFPERGGDQCDEGTQILGLARNNASQIANQMNNTSPNGGTPTAASLMVARDVVAPLVGDGRPLAVLLATDGGPNCNPQLQNQNCTCTDTSSQGFCNSTSCLDDTNAYQAVTAIKDLGVNTFVVGITGVDSFSFVLDEMAVRGGTALQGPPGAPKYYEANDVTALEQALQEITTRVLSCRVSVSGDLDTATRVSVRVGDVVLTRDPARQNGWDVTGPGTVELFGSACDVASADGAAPVVVETCFQE